jgi:hypothetical protein
MFGRFDERLWQRILAKLHYVTTNIHALLQKLFSLKLMTFIELLCERFLFKPRSLQSSYFLHVPYVLAETSKTQQNPKSFHDKSEYHVLVCANVIRLSLSFLSLLITNKAANKSDVSFLNCSSQARMNSACTLKKSLVICCITSAEPRFFIIAPKK